MSMMNITPKDILEKEFGKKLNGYDPEQVDEFLDDIIKQFESLLEENEEVLVKNEALKSEVARFKQKTDKIEDIEEKLMGAVKTAQENATMYIQKAESQARRITEIANQNAKTVIESAHLRMEAVGQEIRKYEKVVNDFKRKFKLFLEEQAAFVDLKLDNDDELSSSAAEVSRSINSLTQQVKEMDGSAEQGAIHLNDILSEAHKTQAADYDLKQSTANLQEIVDELIDDGNKNNNNENQ
mgnify:CR=1 FL=1